MADDWSFTKADTRDGNLEAGVLQRLGVETDAVMPRRVRDLPVCYDPNRNNASYQHASSVDITIVWP